MKLIYATILLSLFSCAHHHEGSEHHHHQGKDNYTKAPADTKVEYDKHCATSVMNGDKHVVGKEEFQLEHGGRFYYFSSQEKMDKFKQNLAKNISKADKTWESKR
jgi:YHS domain-containing protein